MIEKVAEFARPILEFPIIRRTRRNHALEHATIHMLTRKHRGLRMAGRSSDSGFVLMGDIPTENVQEAVDEALDRLRKGERQWALHPNCGTNLVASAALTTSAGVIGLSANRRALDRFTWTMLLTIIALVISQPVGMSLQKHITTDSEMGDLELLKITRREIRFPIKMTLHHVVTQRG